MYDRYEVSETTLLKLRTEYPCECHKKMKDSGKHTSYNIRAHYSDERDEFKGRKIYELLIKCNCCGSIKTINVSTKCLYYGDIIRS